MDIRVKWASEVTYTATIDAGGLREAVSDGYEDGQWVCAVLDKLAAGFGLEDSEEAVLRHALENFPDLLPEDETTEDGEGGEAQVSSVEAAG